MKLQHRVICQNIFKGNIHKLFSINLSIMYALLQNKSRTFQFLIHTTFNIFYAVQQVCNNALRSNILYMNSPFSV